jgi:hypothetical protein
MLLLICRSMVDERFVGSANAVLVILFLPNVHNWPDADTDSKPEK